MQMDSSVAGITSASMQGIRAKEEAIVELISAVRDLVAQCKILYITRPSPKLDASFPLNIANREE